LRADHINDAYATEGRIAALRAADLGVAVATVNDLDRVAALLALGAHGVMTDHAAFARRFD
jgi:glycerophosphoryl diester phosphodiesterase